MNKRIFNKETCTGILSVSLTIGLASQVAIPLTASAASVEIKAASCSAANVQSAVNSAASGTTVLIPAGDCSWNGSQVTVPAGINLRGAGKDLTIIRRAGTVPDTTYLISLNCSNGQSAVLSDLTLAGNGNTNINDKGLGLMQGCVDFKVFNAKFTKFGGAGIEIDGAIAQRGVIFNSEFIANNRIGAGYGVAILADGSWPALNLGTQNAVYLENNNFQGNTTNVASNDSARFVFRYNKVVATDSTKDFAMVNARGLSSAPHGSRSWEIYNNQFSASLTAGSARTA
ncbi:MAG: hypothetical protein Q7U12_10230, partial [Undibacterium sp.]|nr:hypothetical protein [Undibacterium sp.]